MNVEKETNIRPYRIFEDQMGTGKKKKGFYILKKGRRKYVKKGIIVHTKRFRRPAVSSKLLFKIKNTNKKVVGDILRSNFSRSTIGKAVQNSFKNVKGDIGNVGDVTNTYHIQKDIGDIKDVIKNNEDYNQLDKKLKKAQNNVVLADASVRDSRKLLKTTQSKVIAKFNADPKLREDIIKQYPDPKNFNKSTRMLTAAILRGNKAGLPLWQRTKEILRSIYGREEGKEIAANQIYEFERNKLQKRAKEGELLEIKGSLDVPPDIEDISEDLVKDGSGEVDMEGLDTNQINSIMEKFKKIKYAGTFAYDELWQFLETTEKDDFCCIFNSVERSNDTVGHWIAFNCDKKTRSIEINDSFGDNLGKGEWEKIMVFVNRISPEIAWKYKVNGVQEQNSKTDTCGWFSINFLLLRRVNKLSFEDSTGFSNIAANEKSILKLKKQFAFI